MGYLFFVFVECIVRILFINMCIQRLRNFLLRLACLVIFEPCFLGPFWVPMTLIFSIGIFGNIAQYIESHGQFNTGSDFRMGENSINESAAFCFLGVAECLFHFPNAEANDQS